MLQAPDWESGIVGVQFKKRSCVIEIIMTRRKMFMSIVVYLSKYSAGSRDVLLESRNLLFKLQIY